MRLSEAQVEAVRRVVRQVAGEEATATLFGSRLDDAARGGDVDLLVGVPYVVDNPALLIARLSARLSAALGGRSVDVVLTAPNLARWAIHDVAQREGRRL